MQEDREQRIRNAAYRICVEEGFPKNQEERHWRMAELMIAQEDAHRAALPSDDTKLRVPEKPTPPRGRKR